MNMRICAQCGEILKDATTAIRIHERVINESIAGNVGGILTEEGRLALASDAVTTFNNAQAVWDAYRQHLDEHGLLEVAKKGRTAG